MPARLVLFSTIGTRPNFTSRIALRFFPVTLLAELEPLLVGQPHAGGLRCKFPSQDGRTSFLSM
jgi:hypothetical protein